MELDGVGEGATEATLRAAYDLREERFQHGELRVDVLLPRAADALIDEAEFDADERLPYWADLWPSARALTRHLLERPPRERRILELGAGLSLPSLALRSLGLDPLATDYYGEALRFAEVNAARNGLAPLRTALLDWRHPPPGETWELVLAADVLYESRNAQALAALLPTILADGGRMLLADPGRVYIGEFIDQMEDMDWAVEEIDIRQETSDPATGAKSTVRIWRVAVEGIGQR
jgi:predicted nicotinamide N-methyase